jgi:hypothetical protein
MKTTEKFGAFFIGVLAVSLGYWIGFKDGQKPHLTDGVWVKIMSHPYGSYRVDTVTNIAIHLSNRP